MLWLCLHFPRLPLEIFTRSSPEPEACPLVVVQEHQVVLCNQAAGEQGITPGMSSATACALAAPLRSLERDCHGEHTALQQLAQWAYRYSPATSCKPPSDLILEVGASLKLFRGLQTILQQIDQDLCARGFSYHIGLAHTPKAAWLVARGKPGTLPGWFDHKRQALNQQQLDKVLATLPLHLLDLAPTTLKRLHKPGFTVLGDILALPRPALGKRFGRDFLVYLEQLLGTVPDPQVAVEPEAGFQRQLDFLDPIHRSETLLFPMQRLLHELSQFLQCRQLDCPAFSWQLLQQDQPTIALPIRLSRPRHDRETMLALTRTRLESLKLAAPVEGLVLSSEHFVANEQISDTLFEEWRGQQQQSMDELLNTLYARLKPGQVYRLASRDEHVPELAWRRVSALNDDENRAARPICNRPGWLLQRPLVISHHHDTLYWRGKLTLMLGPERIETRWWEQAVKRDYFIARHENGGLYWVYLDHHRQRWHLHGVFA